MTAENVNLNISTLGNVIDSNIEDFNHYNVEMSGNLIDVFMYVPTNSLFFVGKQFADTLEYSNTMTAIDTNVLSEDKIHLTHSQASKLFSIIINGLEDTPRTDVNLLPNNGLTEFQEDSSNLLINNEYKISPNGLIFISEEGSLDLIIDSRKPEAKALRRKFIKIMVTIRQTGSYGVPKLEQDNTSTQQLEILAAAMESMVVNSSEIVVVNNTIATLLDRVDKLKEDAINAIHKAMGRFGNEMKTTTCINNKTAFVSRNWNSTTTISEAICNLVQYSHSQNTLLQGKADDIVINSKIDHMGKVIKPALNTIRIDIVELKSSNSTIDDKIQELEFANTKLNQRLDDLLTDNIPTLRAEIDALKNN